MKKRRSKAQKAATRKMIASNKRRSKGKRRRGKRNPILVTGKNLKTRKVRKGARRAKTVTPRKRHRKSATRKRARSRKGAATGGSKRSRAAKKAARTRKANKEKRSLAAKKAARSRKRRGGHKKSAKSRKRSAKRSSRKSARKTKRKSSKRSAAARKGARTRKRRAAARRSGYQTTSSKHYDASKDPYAGESRRRKRRAKRNPIANPIPLEGGLDFFSGLFAVTIGYLFAAGADRMGSTHALTASTAQGGFIDAPAVGQIYDSEAPATPIWSSGMRLAFNALAIAAPMGVSAMIKSKGPKSFFQLMAFAAIARTVGKAAEDGMSMALKTTGFGLRLYAPELAAQAKLASAATAALPQAAPATFAGAPRQQALPGGAPVVQHRAPPPPAMSANNPVLAPPAVQVAGGPSRTGGLRVDPIYDRPAFNPWASND